MINALFPGSFDPPTYGHLDIIERSAKLFDRVDIVIAVNTAKNCLFSDRERVLMLENITSHLENTQVHICTGLIADYAKTLHSAVLIKGVRNVTDFSYEFDAAFLNKTLNNDLETLFLPTKPDFFTVKSGVVKEIASFHGDISHMVPPGVEKMLRDKYSK